MKNTNSSFSSRVLRIVFITAVIQLFVYAYYRRSGGLIPSALRIEHMEGIPLIDVDHPRFSWINQLKDSKERGQIQLAYQIQVATSLNAFDCDMPDLWESGKVMSSNASLLPYAGKPFPNASKCYWRVRVWDVADKASKWSDPQVFFTGLKPEHWSAKWIGAPWQGEEPLDRIEDRSPQPAPYLRKSFESKKEVASAYAFVSGLGYFEWYVNGKRVGDDVLVPNQTNYGKRPGLDQTGIPIDDDFRAYKVMYLCYDITSLLEKGSNAFGVILGNGFYNPLINWTKAYGSPRFIGQIEIQYTDGTTERIVSDESWKAHPGPIVMDGIYSGETYDANKEVKNWADAQCDESEWKPVALRCAPEGTLVAHTSPTDKVMEQLKPISFERIQKGLYRVDFGEEISGWLRIDDIKGKQGEAIDIKYICESPNGSNRYIMKEGMNATYAPRFTWFVFRKVEISYPSDDLKPEQLTAEAVYTDVETTGEFECSNPLFNQIERIWWRSQTDNMHGGVASDCPHRERSAYTGDGQAACATVMHHFDAAAFYTKWIGDIHDAQNRKTGYVPNAAPWQPGCGGGVAWGAAMNIMPWEFYLHYGDKQMIEQNYEAMKDQLNYMLTWRTEEGTMKSELPLGREPIYWMNLGDWCPPGDFPDDEMIHTFYLWRCADYTSKAAMVMGQKEESNRFATLAKEVSKAFHAKFYDATHGSYGAFGGNIFALTMGVPDSCKELVIDALRSDLVANNNHLNTGIFGTQFLFEVLSENGMHELAYTIMNQRTFPSFGYWIEQGATTTWEQWNGENSRNHPMFGAGLTWFYRKVAGMNVSPEFPGYKEIILRPMITDSLNYASYQTITPYGKAAVRWDKGKTYRLQATVPVGATALLYLPVSKGGIIEESGKKMPCEGVSFVCDEANCKVYRLQSGSYDFEVK